MTIWKKIIRSVKYIFLFVANNQFYEQLKAVVNYFVLNFSLPAGQEPGAGPEEVSLDENGDDDSEEAVAVSQGEEDHEAAVYVGSGGGDYIQHHGDDQQLHWSSSSSSRWATSLSAYSS